VSSGVAILVGLVLLALNGFFVAAEFALLAARRSRIEQLAGEGDRRARHALAGIKELSLMLAGAQLGITICSLLLGAVAEPAIAHLIEGALDGLVDLPDGAVHAISFAIALSTVVFLHMVVGEMAPKSWAISHPESSALTLARPFRAFVLLFRPVIRLLNLAANGVVRAVGVEPQDELALAHSSADLLLLLEESAGHGAIEADEHRLLARTLELSGLDAADAMTPRRDIVAVAGAASATAVGEASRTSGRSRVVIHDGDLDHVLGVVHAKDVLLLDPGERATTTAADLARPLPVTHTGHLLEDLLVEMRTGRQHLAVVVDELGVVAGVVSLEDVLEELIGDFEDETDRSTRRCRRLADGTYAVAGNLRPDELEERTGIGLPEGEWETVAGYVIDRLDRIPVVGDEVVVDGATIRVERLDGYAVAEMRLRLTGRGPGVSEPDGSAAPDPG
jgi:CBS domain containing-hemolysin-like protein